ncbi:MAG: SsrA-binding protein [Candidatus Woykebacteria bacterium GWB1_45_5]|uniref:SsrA-binding protein n=2 Tax=Candidatus Woykeibacteriota TaxID=1817899 RepID=A0A1G1W1G2_9BACT|nr:MAG: SsrA-binding protein [Candidatus Woykebacteria bacterium GWA1_44_8]OGY22340.1 MAG: SsrA-binding protein [Candidatus Woykebacteria bacterium GWB1_45_5]
MKPIINKKASWNYNLFEKFEAGIILNGNEIKSARVGKVSLDEAYVLIRDGDAVLLNSHIAPYEKGVGGPADPRRDRKLLLHKKELDYLAGKLSGSNLVVVPTRLYFKRNYAKIEIALAAGKKKYDKRETLKRREQEKEARTLLRRDKIEAQKQRK